MSILNSPQYQSHVNDYDYDEMDDFCDENSPNKYSHGYDIVDDSEGNDSGKYQHNFLYLANYYIIFCWSYDCIGS